ncbi:hypothetical protein BDQ94DRAFT_152791, partial [Aspergillus welwitschiae]
MAAVPGSEDGYSWKCGVNSPAMVFLGAGPPFCPGVLLAASLLGRGETTGDAM